MKICYLASTGATGHADRWMRFFVSRGHEVHVISSGTVSGKREDGVIVHNLRRLAMPHRLLSSIVNVLPMVLQTRRLLARLHPDILHAQSVEDVALLGALSGFHPFTVTPWGSDVLVAPKESAITRWKVKHTLRKADLITCDADHIKQPLVDLGADPAKINLIYFGVDVAVFKPMPQDAAVRQALGVDGQPVVITCRRLDPNCDITSLITAVPTVLEVVKDAVFVIIGKGSEEAALKQLAVSLGVADHIRFIGWVPHDELPRYLNAADVYVSTALSDAGIAASTAEGMACGLPVVITDFGDNRLWVEDNVNGYLIPLRNPQAVAKKIIRLLTNDGEREAFGRKNRQVIEERNNWEREMAKVERLYETLLQAKENQPLPDQTVK